MTKPYKVKDPYFLKAKKKGYRARSAFKLLDIQDKFHILEPDQRVLDLGSAPGSFLQVIAEIIGPQGRAIGIDLQDIDPFDVPNISLMKGDIYQSRELIKILDQGYFLPLDVVTSDLAPKTSGIRDIDQSKSLDLTRQAYEIALLSLKPGGAFVGKVFQSAELDIFIKEAKKHFKKVTTFKPKATRDRSFETYVIALGFKSDSMST